MEKELQIDIEDFINALEDQSYLFEYFLDLENGNLVALPEDFLEDEFEEDMAGSDDYNRAVVENNPDRFIFINPVDSRDSFKIMEDFVSTILNDLIKKTLSLALSKRKPFRNFKDELNHLPEIQQEWYKFHEDEMKKTANEWLKENNIKAELIRKRSIEKKIRNNIRIQL